MPDGEALGLLLLTGGQGRRLGGPKHDRAHPGGGTWGGHLVRVFLQGFPGGPVQILGEPLPDAKGHVVADPRRGPAVALAVWARTIPPPVRRWWVVPCDQVAWTAVDLSAWHAAAEAADPPGGAWVMAMEGGHEQPLGGFLGADLLPELAHLADTRVRDLAGRLPKLCLQSAAYRGLDVDVPADLEAWQAVV